MHGRKHKWYIGLTFKSNKGGDIEILSFDGHAHCYIKCSICHSDKELFPEPLRVNKYKLRNGQQVCSCGDTYYWNEDQYKIKVGRKCSEVGYTFNGWIGDFNGIDTRLDLTCRNNHPYQPTIDQFTGSKKRLCRKCATERNAKKCRMSEGKVSKILKDFLGDDHMFLRWEDGEYKNLSSKFYYYCKNEDKDFKIGFINAKVSKTGTPSCCYGYSGGYKEDKVGIFYLSSWRDDCGWGCYKYGISNLDVQERFKQQRRENKLDGKILGYIEFQNGSDAALLEKEMKKLYKKRSVPKEFFPDGFTETILDEPIFTIYDLIPDLYSFTGINFLSNKDHEPEDIPCKLPFSGYYKFYYKGGG